MPIVNPPLAVDSPPAAILRRAADLLRTHGLYVANPPDYWHAAYKIPWEPGMALDPLGALGVAIGAHTHQEVTRLLGSWPPATGDQWPQLHPVLTALFTQLGFTGRADDQLESFFRWSDRQYCQTVINTFEACADALEVRAS